MKTIIITGTSRGIGLAAAKKFLSMGWRVIGTYNNTAIPLGSKNFNAIKLDQGSPGSIEHAVNEIRSLTSRIDALVNNAGVILDGHNEDADVDKIRQTIEIDLIGIVDLTERLLPLLTTDGHIVNIDSQYGAFSFPIDDASSTGYRLAKAGLNMYTRTLAFRLKNIGVVVSSLDPGWVQTDMGNDVATDTEKPDRKVEQPAEDIYKLITENDESGYFWRFGKKRDW